MGRPTMEDDLVKRQLSVKEDLMSHIHFVWSSTKSSPPCKSHWKQVQAVFTDGSQSMSPAQSSLVIVVGSLGLVSLQEQKIFFFWFCKAEPCNSRAVKWFSSIHLPPIKPASLLFFLVCLLMCGMWHMPSCLYLVWCVWGDKAAMFIFYVQSHLHRSLLGAVSSANVVLLPVFGDFYPSLINT